MLMIIIMIVVTTSACVVVVVFIIIYPAYTRIMYDRYIIVTAMKTDTTHSMCGNGTIIITIFSHVL